MRMNLAVLRPAARVFTLSLQILWIDLQLLWNSAQWLWCRK
jgi:hypothetical protein